MAKELPIGDSCVRGHTQIKAKKMRVAKSNQLRRLLQIQDVLLSVLVMSLGTNVFVLFDVWSFDQAQRHLNLIGFIFSSAVIASLSYYPRLHRQSNLSLLLYALRYALIAMGGFVVISWLAEVTWLDPNFVAACFIALTAVLSLNRFFLRWWYLKGRKEHRDNYLKVVVIGTGPRAETAIRAYKESADWAVEIVACIDPEDSVSPSLEIQHNVLRGLDSVDQLLARKVVDEVIVCLPRSKLKDIGPVINACEEQGLCLKFMADFYPTTAERFSMEKLGDLPIVSIEPVTTNFSQLFAKRIFDLVLSITLVIAFSPLLVLLAILIKLGSPGPVFYIDKRVGLNKRSFSMIKFRSMQADAAERIDELEHLNEAEGPIFKIENDPRVTRLGRFMRRYSLDELPQLINVVLGHMSLIGPRPLSWRDVKRFDNGIQQRRFSVRPGLACLREVEGRSLLTFERWLELDLQYIDSWSLTLDLKILVRLIPAVLTGRGAS